MMHRGAACGNDWPGCPIPAQRWGAGTSWSTCWRWRSARSQEPGTTPRWRSPNGRRAARRRPWPSAPAGLLPQAAADGKTMRGAARPDGSQVHLLSVFDVTGGHARAQREVDAKTNEIPELEHVTAGLDLTGTVLTLDALHTQSETARRITEAEHGHYLMIIKGNQPSLLDAVRTALAGPEAASSHRRGPRRTPARAPGAAQHPRRPRHWHRLAARHPRAGAPRGAGDDPVLAAHVVRGRQHVPQRRPAHHPAAGAVAHLLGQVGSAAGQQPSPQRPGHRSRAGPFEPRGEPRQVQSRYRRHASGIRPDVRLRPPGRYQPGSA
jgi:Transposase DDE domain